MERFEESDYELTIENGGDPIVVEDIAEGDLYPYKIGESEKYEIRRKGIRLGRFKNMEEVRSFLAETTDNTELSPIQ